MNNRNAAIEAENARILQVALAQSAVDANCAPGDFRIRSNVVVISKPNPGARKYLRLPLLCNLISYGDNVVASVDERLCEFVKAYIDEKDPYRCFGTPQIARLNAELLKYGQIACFMGEYWLPDVGALRALPCAYETRVLAPEDFAPHYLPQWHNALCEERKELDVLAVGAYDAGTLVGLAGCSADCDTMWQIGIDVLPEYRRRGIAAALTSRLALEVLARGAVPFYSCAWSNLASARNAIKCGFRPAWTELSSMEIQNARAYLKPGAAQGAFWPCMDALIAQSALVIDRPKGSKHPKYGCVYPLDYGYLNNTSPMDDGGIDVWRGSLSSGLCDAVIITVDLLKRDSEIKLLLGCTADEKARALRFHNDSAYMKGEMIFRDAL